MARTKSSRSTERWHVGDKAHVISLDEIGIVTYVDRDLISVKLESHHGPRAYWRKEVEHVEPPKDPLEEIVGE